MKKLGPIQSSSKCNFKHYIYNFVLFLIVQNYCLKNRYLSCRAPKMTLTTIHCYPQIPFKNAAEKLESYRLLVNGCSDIDETSHTSSTPFKNVYIRHFPEKMIL